jgi:Protein of unknown function (DUF2934)
MISSMYPRMVSYGPDTARHQFPGFRHRLIERRAYAKWIAKGRPNGTALQDWLEAQAEVDSQLEWDRSPYLCRSRMRVSIVPG